MSEEFLPQADATISIDLVKKAQEGDDEALNALVTRYYERVRKIVRLRLGRRLRSNLDSGDILQETFITAVRTFERFEMRDEASLLNWLARLAENQIKAQADYHGAKKRDVKRRIEWPSTSDGDERREIELAHSQTHPLDRLTNIESAAALEGCLEDLDPEYRELIVLRNYIGCDWKAIATETGRPSASAARMMYNRAMVELGRHMRERGI